MLMRMLDVHKQLEQTTLLQAQNQGAIYQTKQIESRLEGLSVELIHMGYTNATVQKIVEDFHIQWTPSAATAGATPVANQAKQ